MRNINSKKDIVMSRRLVRLVQSYQEEVAEELGFEHPNELSLRIGLQRIINDSNRLIKNFKMSRGIITKFDAMKILLNARNLLQVNYVEDVEPMLNRVQYIYDGLCKKLIINCNYNEVLYTAKQRGKDADEGRESSHIASFC